MSKNKWRVERERHAYTGELMPGWVVKKQEEGSLPTFKTWWKGAAFETWQEALAYADEQARTITATLPRVGETVIIPSQHDAKDEPPLLVRFTNRMTWIYQHSDDYNEFIVLDVDHLEPLALALLAHARKERP